jgi:predicted small secreted protein
VRKFAHLALVVAGFALSALAGCNTTEGFGKDVQGAGGAITDTAKSTKQDIQQ